MIPLDFSNSTWLRCNLKFLKSHSIIITIRFFGGLQDKTDCKIKLGWESLFFLIIVRAGSKRQKNKCVSKKNKCVSPPKKYAWNSILLMILCLNWIKIAKKHTFFLKGGHTFIFLDTHLFFCRLLPALTILLAFYNFFQQLG